MHMDYPIGNSMLLRAIQLASDSILLLKQEKVIFANRSFVHLCNSVSQTVHSSWESLHVETIPLVSESNERKELLACIRGCKEEEKMQLHIHREDGTLLVLNAVCSLVNDQNNEGRLVACIFTKVAQFDALHEQATKKHSHYENPVQHLPASWVMTESDVENGDNSGELLERSRKRRKIDHAVEETNTRLKVFWTFFEQAPLLMAHSELLDNDIRYKLLNKEHREWFLSWNPHCLDKYDATQGILASEMGVPQDVLAIWLAITRRAKKDRHLQLECKAALKDSYLFISMTHLWGNTFSYIAKDITVLKKHQQELEIQVNQRTKALQEALEVKSRFLATMSHEIRTPLSGIMGSLTLLDSPELGTGQKQLIQMGKTCGDQLCVLINDILDFSKIEANQMPLEQLQFSLYDVIRASMDVVALEAYKKRLELICEVLPNTQNMVTGDQIRLRQILVNLATNAVKFSPSGSGHIVITAQSVNVDSSNTTTIQFSVKDQGPGITPAAKKQIFSPFTQADTSVTRKFGGTGLGLTISKKLAELMGGIMWFESTVNVGSTFYFTLKTAVLPSQHKAENLPCAIGKHLLVVEPVVIVEEYLAKWLGRMGMYVTCLGSLEDAMNHLSQLGTPTFSVALVNCSKVDNLLVKKLQEMVPVIEMGYVPAMNGLPFLKKPIIEVELREKILEHFVPSKPQPQTEAPITNVMEYQANILVAEDNYLNQIVIRKLLANLGYHHVHFVENGLKAVETVKLTHFNIVLMDLMMPEMGGIEAAEKIRKENANGPIIIALTADAFKETERKCFASGMQAVLTKPVDKEKLKNLLASFTQRKP